MLQILKIASNVSSIHSAVHQQGRRAIKAVMISILVQTHMGMVAVHMLQPAASWRCDMWTVVRPDAL